ncbi:MAG: ABC transporter permease [Clostridia bacterium]|nr:ABC transporter permease [Clostridia bacterium]
MKTMFMLTKRNIKLFFKDKGTFFSSLISPAILLVLYMVFLANVYEGSFERNLPEFIKLSDKVVEGFVAAQLVSSLIAVTCVTVAFSTNFLMVQDKALRNIYDINVSPVKPHIVSFSYYLASFISTLIVCCVTACLGLIYLAIVGWYMTALDVVLLFVDIIILVFFGTALSSVVHFFLSKMSQIGVVGTLVGVCYGFLCGAYMPMSEFGEGLRNVLGLFPGTYGTSLVRNHTMNGVVEALGDELAVQFNSETIAMNVVKEFRDAFDCNLYFFGDEVAEPTKYAVILVTIVVLIGVFVLLNVLKAKGVNFKMPAKPKKEKKQKNA